MAFESGVPIPVYKPDIVEGAASVATADNSFFGGLWDGVTNTFDRYLSYREAGSYADLINANAAQEREFFRQNQLATSSGLTANNSSLMMVGVLALGAVFLFKALK